MGNGKGDPRDTKSGGHSTPQTGESDTKPAQGGAGTGTKGAPEHEPAAQPGKQDSTPPSGRNQ